jgi:hypothetical protein
MNLDERLSNIGTVLEDNNFTLATYLSEVLARPDHPQHESVILNATPICQAMCSIEIFPLQLSSSVPYLEVT